MPGTTVRAGAARSGLEDAFQAGKAAAAEAVSRLAGEPPALVLVFTKPGYDLAALLAGIRSVTGTALLVGCTGSGEIVEGEYLGFGGGVGVLALTAGPYRFAAASMGNAGGNLDEAGQRIARLARDRAGPSPHGAVLLLADALVGDLQQLALGVYRITGPKVAIVGGAAGDEQKFVRTLVFHDDQILDGGVVALWIASPHPLRVVTRHGWEPMGIPMIVTRAEGTQLIELGGRSAADVYEEQMGIEPGTLTGERFWPTSILHPFGLLQSDGTTVIRMARTRNEEGHLTVQGCLPPPGSAVQVMTGSTEALLDVTEEIVGEALHGRPHAGVLLTFSCAARAAIFGARAPEEPRRLQAAAGKIPTFGYYCCGEFARTTSVLATHNATLTALAL